MKYLRNSMTGEVKHASALAAKNLARYGWSYTNRAAWIEYQSAKVRAAMMKAMPSTRKVLGRVQ